MKHIKLSYLLKVVFVLIIGAAVLSACVGDTTSASQNDATTAGQKWGVNPSITNYYEYQQVMEIYKERDNPTLILNVYTQSMDGSLRCFGKAKGFGIPYGTQFSPPVDANGKPVPEPNGLYPSANTSADWLQLIDPKTGRVMLTFVEPNMIITPATLPCIPLSAP